MCHCFFAVSVEISYVDLKKNSNKIRMLIYLVDMYFLILSEAVFPNYRQMEVYSLGERTQGGAVITLSSFFIFRRYVSN